MVGKYGGESMVGNYGGEVLQGSMVKSMVVTIWLYNFYGCYLKASGEWVSPYAVFLIILFWILDNLIWNAINNCIGIQTKLTNIFFVLCIESFF